MSAALIVLAACSWASPGANPYQGEVPDAVASYTDIPAPVRARLRARMEARLYDDVAEITRDSIAGRHAYAPEIRDMHFGRRTVCGQVDRSKWTDRMVERGLVYCVDGHCLIVPTVCRNVSRVTRLKPLAAPLVQVPTLDRLPLFELPPEVIRFETDELPGVAQWRGPQDYVARSPGYAPQWYQPQWQSPGAGTIPQIPEPATLWLALLGVAWLVWRRK